MKKVFILQNIAREGPGRIGSVLGSAGVDFELRHLEQGDAFPDPESCRALIVLGGPDSANDATPKMRSELEGVSRAVAAQVPYLGICLGMQVLVKACGGSVLRHSEKEIGWTDPAGRPYEVVKTPAGQKDAFLKGLPDRMPVFQLHGETVKPTKGMELLARGRVCENQILRVGKNAYGIQCHFELTRGMLQAWAAQDEDLKIKDAGELLGQFDRLRDPYEKNADLLIQNFLSITGL